MPRLSLLLVGVLLLGACSATVPPPDADPAPPTDEPAPTAALDACAMFTPEALAPLGGTFRPGEEQQPTDHSRGCNWHNDDLSAPMIGITIRDEMGIEDTDGAPTQVDRREARENYDGVHCSYAIAVGDTSQVVVLARSGPTAESGDEFGTCAPALQAAEILAPSLPADGRLGPLADISDTCDLVSAEDFAELGSFDQGRPEMMTSDARGCFWLEDGEVRIIVGVWARHGLDDLDGTPTEINGRAAEQEYRGGSCIIGLAGTDTSRVDVVADGYPTKPYACTVARRAAEIVEPNLPE